MPYIFYIWLLRHRVQDYVYCIDNYSITSGETTSRALSGCVQNYQYLEKTCVIKIQCNIEILKENYANFTYILPITIVNAKSFIKRLQMFESEYHIKCVYNLK